MPQRAYPLPLPATRADPEHGYWLHGQWRSDPYAWMEQLDSAETREWIAEQEAATRAALDAVPARDSLRAALARSTRYARQSPPIRTNIAGRVFFWQASATDDKPRLMLQGSADATPETVLDPNQWPGNTALVFAMPSPDGALVAFGRSVGNAHDAEIHVLDVASGQILPDRPYGTAHETPAWRPDSSGFFYAAYPAPGDTPNMHGIYEHRVGAAEPARRVFGAENIDYWCAVRVSECGRFAVLYTWDFVHANTVFLLRLADDALTAVAPEMRAVNQVQVIGDALLIHTDRDAPRGRACIAPLAAPTAWETIIHEGADTLQTVTGVGGRLYAVYSRAASHRVQVFSVRGEPLREIELPALGAVNSNTGEGVVSGIGGGWAGDNVWLNFQSFVQAPSLYRYDYATDRLAPFFVPDVGLDASEYTTRQVWYESRDGTPVSMFLVHHRDLTPNGELPVRLSGYGGFNISVEPRFTAVQAAWLRMGSVLAFPNIRGGGEYGRAWHAAATKTQRQNAFDDFVAAARWLVAAGYTTPARLVARGNSNGGLLVAVAALQAPDAFGAVLSRAGMFNMLRFHLFGNQSGAVVEFGSPDDPVEGAYLAGYSPYHNVRAGRAYPIMLFVSALNDRIAPPYDPLKMVARLQAEATEGGPFLLLPLRDSGHGGGTTLSALIEQDTDELCFYCWALGIEPHD